MSFGNSESWSLDPDPGKLLMRCSPAHIFEGCGSCKRLRLERSSMFIVGRKWWIGIVSRWRRAALLLRPSRIVMHMPLSK